MRTYLQLHLFTEDSSSTIPAAAPAAQRCPLGGWQRLPDGRESFDFTWLNSRSSRNGEPRGEKTMQKKKPLWHVSISTLRTEISWLASSPHCTGILNPPGSNNFEDTPRRVKSGAGTKNPIYYLKKKKNWCFHVFPESFVTKANISQTITLWVKKIKEGFPIGKALKMNDSHTSATTRKTKSQLPGVWNAGRDCPELISIHFKGQEFFIRSRETSRGQRWWWGGPLRLSPTVTRASRRLTERKAARLPLQCESPTPLPMDVTFPCHHSATKLTIIYLLNPKRPYIARTAIRKICKNKTPTCILLILPTVSWRQFT